MMKKILQVVFLVVFNLSLQINYRICWAFCVHTLPCKSSISNKCDGSAQTSKINPFDKKKLQSRKYSLGTRPYRPIGLFGSVSPKSDTKSSTPRPKKKSNPSKTSKVGGTRTKGKKINDSDEKTLYWKKDTDEIIQTTKPIDPKIVNDCTTYKRKLKLTVHGKPIPLRRHRTGRGFMYNPSAKAQRAFQEVVKSILLLDPVEEVQETFFDEDDFLVINLVFKMRRPRKHFIGNKAGPGRLRESAEKKLFTGRVDVDNLAKFVLDSLNELVYPDDRQVVSLHAIKVYDCDDDCEGSTEISIQSINDQDMEELLMKQSEAFKL